MAQPPTYNRLASFTNLQAIAPSTPLPGNTLDAEFNAVKATSDAVLANLALIQRNDGALANGSVGTDQLSTALSVGINTWTVWVTATAYAVNATVFHGSAVYRCAAAHTSGTFATDLTAVKWTLVIDLAALVLGAASGIAVTPTGGIVATDVQTALAGLDTSKAAVSHTHPSSAITDSTAAGRAVLTAATAAAQRTALGLGALALLDTVAVAAITGNLAFSGILEPAALVADTNDWAPTGVATNSTIRMSASAAVNLTGLLAPTADGDIKILENVGTTNSITLLPSNASSAAANRFLLPYAIAVHPNQSVVLKYDLDVTTPRWRLAHTVSARPVAGEFKNLKVTNGATPNSDAAVTADSLMLEDSTGEVYRARTVSVTASSGSAGANGLDTGTVANSTWYSTWVIYNPTTNTVAALLSLSATAPTMPSGYTFKARVGWMRTDSSAHFLLITQFGRRVRYRTSSAAYPIIVSPGTTGNAVVAGYTTYSIANFVPPTASMWAWAMTGVNTLATLAPENTFAANTSLTNPPPVSINTSNTDSRIGEFLLVGSYPQNIYSTQTNNGAIVQVTGWEDSL